MVDASQALALALVLSLVLVAIPPVQSAQRADFDTSWLRANKYYDITALHGLHQFSFRTIVAAANGTTVTTSWQYGDIVQQASYDRATRQDLARPGHYAFLWVNDADVDAGSAWIGKRRAALVSSTLAYHLFVSGMREYYFSRGDGVLLHAKDLATGTEFVRGVDGDLLAAPAADNDPRKIVRAAYDSAMEFLEGEPAADPPDSLRLSCRGVVPDATGGVGTCSDRFVPTGRFGIHRIEMGWPPLSAGYMNVTLSDTSGEYYAYQCYAGLPYVGYDPQNETTCDPEWSAGRGVDMGIAHTWRLRAHFNYCLNPILGFTCEYDGEIVLTGRVARP
ncbi:MAG TPA: hypothetical protein VM582_01710 [Candidatus Thermoplasmatota archaeon]|nr:hypothetical protein [Candidatus Thermoplasmatota archaeon]